MKLLKITLNVITPVLLEIMLITGKIKRKPILVMDSEVSMPLNKI